MPNVATNRPMGKMLPLPGLVTRDWRTWMRENIAKGKSDNFMIRVEIGPELAELMLAEFNGRNRPLRANGAEDWSQRIQRGEWMVTSQGISVGEDGHLNNGQHRLKGIVLSGRAVQCWVMFGEPVEAFYVLDTQRTRSAADALHILNEQNVKALAAAARLLNVVLSSTPRSMNSVTTRAMNHAAIAQTVMNNPGLREATTRAYRFAKCLPKSSTGGAAVAWYLIRCKSARSERLDEFWNILCTGAGIMKERDACNVLRRTIQVGKITHTKDAVGPYTAASIIIAWNLWAWGKQANGVTWPDKAPFPVPR